MEDILCSICLNEFHERDFVPKVLDCSHTFCASCVQKLLKSTRECPWCKKKMERTEYPTNLMGLKLMDFCNKSSNNPTSSLRSLKSVGEYEEMRVKAKGKIEILRGEIENLKKERKGLDERIEKKQKLSQSLQSDLVKLKQLEEEMKQLNEKTIEETTNVFCRLKDLCLSVDQELLKLEDFEDKVALNREVTHRAKGGSIFWFKDVKEERRYGKLMLNRCLLGNSLSRFEEGLGKGATLVQFDDIAPLVYEGVDSFLLLQSGPDGPEILIKIRLDYPQPLTTGFARLCTGELGLSYKEAEVRDRRAEGCHYRSYLFGVDKYMEDGRERSGAIETLPRTNIMRQCLKEEVVVIYGSKDGALAMVKIKETCQITAIVGVVSSPSFSALEGFPWEKQVRVRDCGICVPF